MFARLRSLWRDTPAPEPESPFTAARAVSPADSEADDSPSGFSGVHDVVKKVDYWFAMEAGQIEREADQLAEQWATENLPTLNEVTDDMLEPEGILQHRCKELWQRWPRRLHTRLQDAIDHAGAELASSVAAARAAITDVRLARRDLVEAETTMDAIRRDTASKQGPVQYKAYIGMRLFLALSVLLVAVEFIANQPVFRIIWPMQSDVNQVLTSKIAQMAAGATWTAGFKVAAIEIASYLEASVLAFVVVLLLFYLAKTMGAALRPLLALKAKDYPYSSRSIASLHRQHWLVLGASCVGTVLVLIFLYNSRSGATELVAERVQIATEEVTRINAEIDTAQMAGGFAGSASTSQLVRAQANVDRFQDALTFAKTIQANNFSIFMLNVSLVLFALVLGFMHDSRNLAEQMGEHPDLAGLKGRCGRHEAVILRRTDDAQNQIMRGEQAIARVEALRRAEVRSTADAKRARLNSIIPRWRSLNARLRGLDPTSIAAFRRDASIALSDISYDGELRTPEVFAAHVSTLRSFSDALSTAEDNPVVDQSLLVA